MALTDARKAALARMELGTEADMVRRVNSFVLRAGMSHSEFSEQIHYSVTAVRLFLAGRYDAHHPSASNSLALRAAMKEYLDTHDFEASVTFRGNHHRTSDFVAVRKSAMSALDRGTAYLVDGPPGTQKTWTLRQIEREINTAKLGHAVYVYARVSHSPGAFLSEVCTAAGIPNRGSIDQLLRKLRFFLGRGRTLLMIDEAQHLELHGLEVVRQLLDLPPYFGVILAGSHDLSQRLSHWQMEQWRSRLRKTHFLNGLTEREAQAVLIAELGAIPQQLIEQTLSDATSEGSRNGKKFKYISARNLFDAIESTKLSIAPAPVPAPVPAPAPAPHTLEESSCA